MLYEASHNWLNKQMGLKPEDHEYYHAGKKAHRIIQDHVSGKKPDERLLHIQYTFPIVEEVDFDSRCKFNFNFHHGLLDPLATKNKYNIIGFVDGLDPDNKTFLEIKSADPVWSLAKFQRAMQRKLYALAKPDFKEAILITCSKDPSRWTTEAPRVYSVPLTDQDRKEASDWILGGIKMIEAGQFDGGLENGRCNDPRCYFGVNCQFK